MTCTLHAPDLDGLELNLRRMKKGETRSPVPRKLNASPPDVAQLFTYAMNRKRVNG